MTPRRGRVPRAAARAETGSVVLALPVLGVLLVVTLVLAFQGGVLVARRQVQAAADLAALAGAAALQRGADGCHRAGEIARRNDARVLACEAGSDDVLEVRVGRPGPTVLGRTVDLEATARAGPAAAPSR